MRGNDVATRQAAAVAPRSRTQLAVAIARYALTHRVDELPVEFFRCDEEVAMAKSLTREETLFAAGCVMQPLAKQPTVTPRVQALATQWAAVWRRTSAFAQRCTPRMRARAA